jgi:hypothetical protein
MLEEYVEWIGLDLAFQEIDAELAGYPASTRRRAARCSSADGSREASPAGTIGLRPLKSTPAAPERMTRRRAR